jgi:hypothetical protein
MSKVFSDEDPLSPVAGAVLYPHAQHRPLLMGTPKGVPIKSGASGSAF